VACYWFVAQARRINLKTVTLGQNGPCLPALGQGTMGIGGYFSSDYSQDVDSVNIIKLGIDLGLSVIDTAEVYGAGHTEELVGRAIEGQRDKVCIVSKFSPERSNVSQIIAAADQSLRRLRTDYIDVYMPHWPNPSVPLSEVADALDSLLTTGKVRWVGLSNYGLEEVKQFTGLLSTSPLKAIQSEYSLSERSVESSLLPFCTLNDIALIAYSPFGQGKLLAQSKRTEVLFSIADDYGITPAQLALVWLLSQQQTLAIPKTGRERALRENAAALDIVVGKSDLELLAAAFTPIIEFINPVLIDVTDSDDNRKIYKTLAEALENRFNMKPSPFELSEEIIAGNGVLQKPVKVRRASASGRYVLVDGRTKFWGWVIAFGTDVPIPSIVEDV
jgi:aryl-alcohol dehydrogenase-like predicted oxidoreductase